MPEYVIPTDYTKHNRAVELLNQAKTAITGTGINDNDEALTELSDKFDTLLAMFRQLLGLNNDQLLAIKESSFDKKSLYTQMAKDQGIANSQRW